MPVNETLMSKLKSEYGAKKGPRVYYAMEQEGKAATKPAAVKKSQASAKKSTKVHRLTHKDLT